VVFSFYSSARKLASGAARSGLCAWLLLAGVTIAAELPPNSASATIRATATVVAGTGVTRLSPAESVVGEEPDSYWRLWRTDGRVLIIGTDRHGTRSELCDGDCEQPMALDPEWEAWLEGDSHSAASRTILIVNPDT
jgi:hypothetical protein